LVLIGNLSFPIMVMTGALEADEPLNIEELIATEFKEAAE